MDKTEIQTGPPDRDDRPLKGLQDTGKINFECANCCRSLLVLQLAAIEGAGQSTVLTRVAVKCGFCGCYSNIQQVSGQFYPGAPNDRMAFDIADDYADAPDTDVLFEAWSK